MDTTSSAMLAEADLSAERRRDLLCAAIEQRYNQPPAMPAETLAPTWPIATYDDHVIVSRGDGYLRIDYTIAADGTVTLGEPVAVEQVYRPIEMTESALFEAIDATGRTWDVLMIRAGTSGNAKHYPADVLREAAPLFEGAKAYADHPTRSEQRDRPERSIRDIVGFFEGVRYDDAAGGLRGTFRVLESADWLRQMLKSAWDANRPDLLGFSIHAVGRSSGKQREGGQLIEAIERVVSCDVVTTPGAGGRLLGVLESEREAEMPDQTGAAGAVPPFDADAFRASILADVRVALTEALRVSEPAPAPAPAPAPEAQPAASVDLLESVAALRRQIRQGEIRERVASSGLPKFHSAKVVTRLLEASGRRDVDDAEVDGAIAEMRELIAESGTARAGGLHPTIATGDNFRDKFSKGVEGFFKNADVDGVPRFATLNHMDIAWRQGQGQRFDPLAINGTTLMESLRTGRVAHGGYYGDRRTMDLLEAQSAPLMESLTTSSWGEIFADNLYKMTLREYSEGNKYGVWRQLISTIEPAASFQTRHWTRYGGYGDLSTVAEAATYTSFTSPGDEEVAYAISKRGNLEDITFEMLQDPTAAGQIRGIPRRMGRAAARTLYKFVFHTLLADNPTMDYDSVALYHASHGNTASSAGLSVGTLQTGRQAMRDQTAFGESSEVIGDLNEPRFLLVPNELQGIAERICNSAHPQLQMSVTSSQDTSQLLDPNMFRGKLTPIVIDTWTDANDWMLVADPSEVNTIVMGFLNGREEPEMFVQDNPTQGSMFSADKITYKIRHIYGGDVADHRSFYRGQG